MPGPTYCESCVDDVGAPIAGRPIRSAYAVEGDLGADLVVAPGQVAEGDDAIVVGLDDADAAVRQTPEAIGDLRDVVDVLGFGPGDTVGERAGSTLLDAQDDVA